MRQPKTARLANLTPETRRLVEAELAQGIAEDRLATLVKNNTRLLDAMTAVDRSASDDGTEARAIAVVARVYGEHLTRP